MNILEAVNKEIRLEDNSAPQVSRATVYKDLYDMEFVIYHIEMEQVKSGKNVYWRYLDPDASISKQPLSPREANLLREAIQVISRFKGLPQFEWTHEIIPVLEKRMGLDPDPREIISFDSNLDYKGLPNLQPILNAIRNKRVLNIAYQSFRKSTPSIYTIHPQLLKQHTGRWYVMSCNNKSGDAVDNFALDRIKSITETSEKYIQAKVNWDDYFYDLVGVTRMSSKAHEIKIKITNPLQAAYIDTKPLHPTQKIIKDSEDNFVISIKAIPNWELEKLLLSFGEHIQILSPASLKERIQSRTRKLFDLYHSA